MFELLSDKGVAKRAESVGTATRYEVTPPLHGYAVIELQESHGTVFVRSVEARPVYLHAPIRGATLAEALCKLGYVLD